MNRLIFAALATLAILASQTNVRAELTDGLVGYYPFDDGSGEVLSEHSGVGNAGELFNFDDPSESWVEGIIGGALEFDGLDDFVIAPDMPLAETALTVSIWGFAHETPTWGSLVKNWGGSAVGQFHFGLGEGGADTLNIFVTQADGAAFNAGTDSQDIETEVWEHYAFVANPDSELVTLYRNGEVVDERPYNGTFTQTPNSSSIGIGVKTDNSGQNADGGAPGYWNGRLDDLGIWHRALSQDEVLGIYTAGLQGLPILGGPSLPGDFDGSGVLEAADIDLLSAEVRAGTNRSSFDLTGDNVVDNKDRIEWVEVLRKTYFGDSNLDGEFSSTDFVVVFTAGQYEDGIAGNSTWETGDWNGDTEFDSSDFVTAFTAGGYELGLRPSVQAVPEPTGLLAYLGWAVAPFLARRRGGPPGARTS